MATSTKWRLNVTAGNVGSVNIAEMAVYTNGTNLCTGGTGTASTANASHLAPAAFDGNNATWWQSNAGLPQWLQYDFATAVTNPTSYTLTHDSGGTTRAPTGWTLQYWDGTSFQVYDTQASIVWGANLTLTFTPTIPTAALYRSAFGAQKPARRSGLRMR